MDWNLYKQLYLDFEVSINQGEIISQSSVDVLRNYPHDLPKEVKKSLDREMTGFTDTLSQFLDKSKSDAKVKTQTSSKRRKSDSRGRKTDLFYPTLLIAIYNISSGRQLFKIDFSKVIYSQQLAMAFAHFDAFLGDSVRVILQVKPNILRKNKQIAWNTLIDLGTWENVLEHLSETFVYDFGWLEGKDKLDFFEEKFGFDLQLSEKEKVIIIEGELLRHLIIHNGGRVSAEHIRRSKNKSLKIGEQLPIDHEQIERICEALRKASSKLFIHISKSFFKKTDSDLTCIPQFSNPGHKGLSFRIIDNPK